MPGTSSTSDTPLSPISPRWRWIEAGLIVLFWLSFALLEIAREMFDMHEHRAPGLRTGLGPYLLAVNLLWAAFTPVVFSITRRLLPDRLGWTRTLLAITLAGVALAVVFEMLDHALWNAIVAGAMQRSLSPLAILDNFHFLPEFFVYGVVLIAGYARAYFLRSQEHRNEANQLRVDAARLQSHLSEARLQALRMQINPHFLFNTLHVISDHFEENPRSARRMIALLSDILRYSFDSSATQEVPLGRELKMLEGYLEIQRFRFEDRLQVQLYIEDSLEDALVPTLILQPLVENAIKHGISALEGEGQIAIRSWREGGELHLRVADNGPGEPLHGAGNKPVGIGLRNTRERLETLYGDRQRFTAENAPAGGFVAHIVLPYHTGRDHFLASVDTPAESL